MNIEFKAQSVEYADAIDGEIVQVHFIENKNDDVFNPKYCSVGISISYEFPPEHLTAQYDNAKGEQGEEKIEEYTLKETRIELWLSNSKIIAIDHKADKATFKKLSALLAREVGEPKMV